MGANRKPDWQRFPVINKWCLHLSLRAHINYPVAAWTCKMGDAIDAFRVTAGSARSGEVSPCGTAVEQPHSQSWAGASRRPGQCGQEHHEPSSPQIPTPAGWLIFSLLCELFSAWDQVSSTWRPSTDRPRLQASLGIHGEGSSSACSCLPHQQHPPLCAQGSSKQKSSPFLPSAADNRKTGIIFLFCSATVSLSRHLDKRGIKGNLHCHRE